MSLEQQLRSALHDGARHLDMVGAGSDAARRRARQIVRRRRAVPISAAAVVVAGGTIASVVALQDDEPDQTVLIAPVAGSTLVESDLEWRETEATVSMTRRIVHTSDGYTYALSTAPGTKYEDYPNGAIPQALYRTADGESWQALELGEAPWMTDLTERDGVLYAVGTGPATHEGVDRDIVAAISEDDGASWNKITLPSAATAPAVNGVDVQPGVTNARVVAGADLLVATLRTEYWVDVDSLLTDEERAAGAFAAQTESGIQILPEPQAVRCTALEEFDTPGDTANVEAEEALRDCAAEAREVREPAPLREIPWADLGFTGPAALNVDEMFVSTDGRTWEPVTSPFTEGTISDLVATADGFVAATMAYDGVSSLGTLWHSPDGRTWTRVSEGLGYLENVGVAGDRLVAVTEATVHTSVDGGRSWTATDLTSVLNPNGEALEFTSYPFDAGPLGIAIGLSSYPRDPDPAVRDERLVEPDVAEVKMPEQLLLTSEDGLAWSVTPVSTITDGREGYIDNVVVGTNGIAVTMSVNGTDGQTWSTFVGTPTR